MQAPTDAGTGARLATRRIVVAVCSRPLATSQRRARLSGWAPLFVALVSACDTRGAQGRLPASAGANTGAAVTPSHAAVPIAHDRGAQMSPKQFVEDFYHWYLPQALGDASGPAWVSAVNVRTSDLSPDLARALQDDAAAQAHATGEIVGLDADPFLGGQDPCEHYDVGAARPQGAGYAVDIYGVCSGKRHDAPDVVAEVMAVGGSWQFTNFRYPSVGSDLRRELAEARAGRHASTP